MKQRETVKIQSFNVDTFKADDALEYIWERGGFVVTINPEMISYARSNPDFAAVIREADLVIPDGVGVELGLKILGHGVRRIAGIEFAKSLVKKASETSSPVAFVGAKPEVIKKAVENLQKEFPQLNAVYVQDGYFQDEGSVLDGVKSCNPRLVLAALGSPKQELFIKKALKDNPGAVMIGIGGSFDVWSGMVKRAPVVYQKLGIEWLYRTIKEPKRFKRIFPTLPLFVFRVLYEKFLGDKNA